MIAVEDLTVRFGGGTPLEVYALRSLSLSLQAGEFVTVIGSNGAGKSTLLSCLAGDVSPSSGRIIFEGRDVTRLSSESRSGFVARVFQDPLLGTCGSLTLEENMALALDRGSFRGFKPALDKDRRHRFRESLSSLGLGLENRLCERVDRLSGGQRQVLSLVMAMLCDARLFLLDEHTAALDPRMSAFVMDLTSRLVVDHGLTTVMVTHSLEQALSFGDRLVMLNEGRVVFESSGRSRQRLSVKDLVSKFSRGVLDNDRMLLG